MKDEPELKSEMDIKPEAEQTKPVSAKEGEIKFMLEDIEEKPENPKTEEDWEPKLKNEQQPLFEEELNFEEEIKEEKQELNDSAEEETEVELPETFMFTLDDDFEEEVLEEEKPVFSDSNVQTETKKEVKAEVKEKLENPFDAPISQSLSQAIEERRARLKQFNYKFKNTLNNKTVDEVENVPAYKRQGVELSEKEDNKPSDFIVGKDSNNETKIRPNNFLHDNVD
jgi:cell division protein FtsZ